MKNIFRRLRRRSQLSGATVKGRHALPFQITILVLVMAGVGIALMWWMGSEPDGGEQFVSRNQLLVLEQQLVTVTNERDRLQAIANAAESQITMEKATQEKLAEQARRLTEENIRLKEDLAFFEKLLPAKKGRGISIRSLRAELIAPNQIRYRVLIMQGGKNPPAFVGELQLAVSVVAGDEIPDAMIIFPQESNSEPQHFALSFRHYQRLEGVLTLPEGSEVTAVQARVLEKGKIRAQEMVNL